MTVGFVPDACFNGQEDLFQRIGLVILVSFILVDCRNFVFLFHIKIAIVYKSCGNYIVELELFPDSKTNLIDKARERKASRDQVAYLTASSAH